MSLSTSFTWLPVTTLPNGGKLRLPLHVLKGRRAGPTLGLSGMLHGNEPLPSAGIIREVLASVDPAELSGIVMAVPVCNPLGASALSRQTPRDGVNLNDAFALPGDDSAIQPVRTVSEQIAAVLTEGFLAHLDYHIDFHSGDGHLSAHMIEFSADPESMAMAQAFNMPILLRDAWGEGQMWGASNRLGAKVIVAECGGGGQLYDEWLSRGVRGTFNVMRRLGMLPGEVEPPPVQRVVDNTRGHHSNLTILRPRESGLIFPEPGITPRTSFDGQPISGVSVLGRLLNQYDLTLRQAFETPFERTLLLATVVMPSWHYAGDITYIIADASAAEVLS